MEGVTRGEPTSRHNLGTCPKCAALTRTGQKFCGRCGERLPALTEAPARRRVAGQMVPEIISRRITFYHESLSPRELHLRLGLALTNGTRYREASQELERALAEHGAAPPSNDIRFFLAKAYELAGARDLAVRTYLEAVAEESDLARQLLPYLHLQLTPEAATALIAWFEAEWETAVAAIAAEPIDRLHVDIFRCRMHLYVRNFSKARVVLRGAKEVDPEQFDGIAPELLALETLPQSLASADDGNAVFALAEINHILGQPEAVALIDKALAVGLTDQSPYPEAPGYALKAAILEATGDRVESASWYIRRRPSLRLARRLRSCATSLGEGQAAGPLYTFPPTGN